MNTLDNIIEPKSINNSLRKGNRTLLILNIMLAVFNTIMGVILDFAMPNTIPLFFGLQNNFFSFPILSFIVGLLFAIIPVKKQPYFNRWIRASLICMIVFASIIALFFILQNIIPTYRRNN